MNLSCQEFIRRFLLHVLPKGFHKIRHYGFLANGRAKRMVSKIRILLKAASNTDEHIPDDHYRVQCPECGKGFLIPIWIINRFGQVASSTFTSTGTGYAFDTS